MARHIARKKPCIQTGGVHPPEPRTGESTHTCESCGRVFTRGSSLKRHKAGRCPGRREGGTQHERELRTLRKRVEELEASLGKTALVAAPEKVHVETHTNIGQQVNIQVNVWGKESDAHITEEEVEAILREAAVKPSAEAGDRALLRVTRRLYEPAENRTCYVANKQRGDVAVRCRAGKWEIRSAAEVVPELAKRGGYLLCDKQPYHIADVNTLARIGRVLQTFDTQEGTYFARSHMRHALLACLPEKPRGPPQREVKEGEAPALASEE